MKSIFFGIAIFALSVTAQADEIQCHALKFDSYFVATNLKDNLKRLNPDVSRPNFNGHYLLLRSELAMETLYLIASCETGEFLHEKLSGDLAVFSIAGPGVDLKDKKETTHYEWDGKSWLKGETVSEEDSTTGTNATANAGSYSNAQPTTSSAKGGSSSSPTNSTKGASTQSSPAPTMLSRYESLFAKFPVKEILGACTSIDLSSNFRAQKSKDSIPKYNANMQQPNFAGSKYLLKTESIFETVTLIADCKTGKIANEFLKDHVNFKVDSRLAIVNSSDSHPELWVWSEPQWVQIADPTQNHKDKISNTLYGDKATLLVNTLPNPHHLDVLRFENLKVTETLRPLFADLNVETIPSGKCRLPHGETPVCEVDTQ